jgi:O-antigen ligase
MMKPFEKIVDDPTKWYTFLISSVTILFPFSIKLTNIATILLIIFWIIEGDYRQKFSRLKGHSVIILIIVFFALLLFSILYSKNFSESISYLEKKLQILVLPIIIGSIFLSEKQILVIFKSFLLTILFACIIGWAKLIWTYYTTIHEFDLSYYQWHLPNLINIHAPYLAMYLAFAAFFSIVMYLKGGPRVRMSSFFYIMSILISNFTLLFIASRTALFAHLFGLLFVFLFFGSDVKVKARVLSLAVISALLVILFFSLEKSLPYLHSKLTNFYGASERIQIWESALIVMDSDPIFGVGIGDATEELGIAYHGRFESELLFEGDLHNEYLAVAVRIGIFGLVILVSVLVVSFIHGILYKSPLLIYLSLLFIFCFLTETVLARNAGVVFFSLLLPLSFIYAKSGRLSEGEY